MKPEDLITINSTQLEYLFVFAVVWSIGSVIDVRDRERFDKVIKNELVTGRLPGTSLFNSYFDVEEK